MRKIVVLLWWCIWAGSLPAADYDHPKHEIRAVWLTTIFGLDWPTSPATNETERNRQKQELRTILDRLKEAHFNTVFVQTRLRGDVIYRSQIEPISAVFTGQCGKWPEYDPLAFVIDECHKRGMECHAFFVTYPVGSAKMVKEQGRASVVKRHPELCIKHRGDWYLNPGHPGTSDYLLTLVKEVVKNYDIDGIQFDYIRYPEGAQFFPDKKTYQKYGKGQSLENWRRDNINRIIARAHDWVKKTKPWVQVSSSPLGKYSKRQHPNARWTAYEDAYQDPRAWLKAGKQDMIVPMMYYQQQDFYPFVNNWLEHSGQRNMVVGLGAYRLSKKEGNWKLSEITDQIRYVRRQGVKGCAFFRTQFVIKNEKGLYNELKNRFFKYPAQLPPLVWMNEKDSVPCAPQEIVVVREQERLKLSWKGRSSDDYTYTIYYSQSDSIDMTKAQSILATGIRENVLYLPIDRHEEKEYSFCVTASNRYRMESQPSRSTYYYLSEYEK